MCFVLPTLSYANSNTTLQAIKARGFMRCASTVRPGLASQATDGRWSGLEVEVCRAVATAILGKAAPFAYHRYEVPGDDAALIRGDDDIAFLTPAELENNDLGGAIRVGPPIFIETQDLMVAIDSPIRHLSDLAMSPVCFIAASAANDSLDAWFGVRNIPLIRYAFREDDEMYDAYAVQRCKAVVGEATDLAQARRCGGINHLASRLLTDHLDAFPISVVTGKDPQWAALVASVVRALMASQTKARSETDVLGLTQDWQATVRSNLGEYSDIFRRTLGTNSDFKLDQGLNIPTAQGELMVLEP